jgi:cysteinyl-tRNA synthetase
MSTKIRVHSTLSRRKEDFVTTEPGKVTMYVCGPTVYKPSHVGHLVGPIIFDTIKRFLTHQGYGVNFIVNITDIDDKLIVEAAKRKTTVKQLAEEVTADYFHCLKALGVTSIDRFPKATEHIPEIQAMITKLIADGHAYASAGDVYFDVASDGDYGKLCNRDPEQLEAGARIEVSEKKKNPGDFALWKGAKPGEPAWESPWGPGRPGWHIECSAMSMRWLGETIDIHGGGLDLQFPHHENELAQSESYTGKPFARYWLHNGLMKTGDKKMSKSEGNEIVVGELLKKYPAETLRTLILSSHYRSPIEYSENRLIEVGRSLETFHRFYERVARIVGQPVESIDKWSKGDQGPTELVNLRTRFIEAMSDDFNTSAALSVLFDLVSHLNRFIETNKLEKEKTASDHILYLIQGVGILRELSGILGILSPSKKSQPLDNESIGLVDGLMGLVIELRALARKEKNYGTADLIRTRLSSLGITLEDRPDGTGFRIG